MATVKFAQFQGTCPLCSCAFYKGVRIARSPMGWGHESCVAEWKGARTGLVASGSSRPRTYLS